MGKCRLPISGENVKAEVTAQTPVIADIAENFEVEITTPSGSNKQILQGNNENLLNIKNNAKKSGAYAWEKCTPKTYEVLSNPSIKLSGTNGPLSTVYNVIVDTNYDIDESFFDGFAKDSRSFTYSDGILTYDSITVTYDSTTNQLTFSSAPYASNITISYTGEKIVNLKNALAEDFICFVISNNPTEYPDGAVKDGYFYKLVGGESEFGEITTTSAISTDTGITIFHHLGQIPTFAFMCSKNYQQRASKRSYANINGWVSEWTNSDTISATDDNSRINKTESTVTFLGAQGINMDADTYLWIVIA